MIFMAFFNFIILSAEKINDNSKVFDSFRKAFSGNFFANTVFKIFLMLAFFIALMTIAVIAIMKFIEWKRHQEVTEKTMEDIYDLMGLTEDDVKLLEISASENKLKPYYKIILYKSSFKRYIDSNKAKELGINIDYLQRKIFRK